MLQAREIQRSAGNAVLLHPTSLRVTAGDCIALVGPSGAGKTVLLRALSMLDRLQAGEIWWRGATVAATQIPAFRSQVLLVSQRATLLEGTVAENLQTPFQWAVHRGKAFEAAIAARYLRQLGRDGSFFAKQQRDLSGGESQIAVLVRALVLNPAILLLDEPTAALDSDTTADVETMLQGWLQEQPNERAMMWVTHDRQQASRVANQMLTMQNGKLHQADPI